MADDSYVTHVSEFCMSSAQTAELMRGVFARGCRVRLRVKGFSMWPFVRNDDVVTMVPLEGQSVVPGDIVAYVRRHPQDNKLTIHRILCNEKNQFMLKGDNLKNNDEGPILSEQVLGKIIEVKRDGKQVRFGIHTGKKLVAKMSRNNVLWGVLFSLQRLCRILTKRC